MERYKELYHEAVEACVAAGPNEDGTNKAWLWEEEYAKLITEECIKAVCKSKNWPGKQR